MTNVSETKTDQERLEEAKKNVRLALLSSKQLTETALDELINLAQYLEAQRHKSHHNPV